MINKVDMFTSLPLMQVEDQSQMYVDRGRRIRCCAQTRGSADISLGASSAGYRPHPESGHGEAGMNWRRFFRRDEVDAEQRDELDFYLDVTTKEYIERGMEPAAARAAARRKLGNTTLIREEVYRMNTLTFMEGVLRDARHAVRMIRTKPGFSRLAEISIDGTELAFALACSLGSSILFGLRSRMAPLWPRS